MIAEEDGPSLLDEGARWHHERSAAALKSTLAQGDAALGVVPSERTGVLGLTRAIGSAVASMMERAESKQLMA